MRALLVFCLLLPLGGCFSERSFPMLASDYRRVPASAGTNGHAETTREWLVRTHTRLADLLPKGKPAPLTTEGMVNSDGRSIDTWQHFGIRPGELQSVWTNFSGLLHTAQASHTTVADRPPAHWDGFDDVWVPVAAEVQLFGRLGFAKRDGRVLSSDCIVILPGLLGDLSVERTRTLAAALVERGFHVLAIELRGFGRTDERYPNVYYNFGIVETDDLLAVSEWLEDMPRVRRTGLIGFCWGANHALMTAWDDGRASDHASVNPRLQPYQRPRTSRRHFEAGIMAFSPVLRFEDIIESCKRPWNFNESPVMVTLQEGIAERKQLKGHAPVDGNLRTLIDAEFARSRVNYPEAVEDGLDYLRFLEFRGRKDYDKLESARMPVLIVQAANDPLALGQDVADLIAQTSNPNVAAVLLPGGGHVGFMAYARAYTYSLILNFFEREREAPRPGKVASES